MRKTGACLAVYFMCLLMLSIPITALAEDYISIDDIHTYGGMKQPFSTGYEPEIKKNQMKLVIPFVSNEDMEHSKIAVSVEFDPKQEGPFSYKNYRKELKKSKGNLYLYQCNLELKPERKNGSYPLYLKVMGKTNSGKPVSEIFTIYVEITDGTAEIIKEPEQSSGEENTVIPEPEIPAEDVPKPEEKEPVIHQPRVILDASGWTNQKPEPGGDFTSAMTAKNCSSSMEMVNVKIKVSSENTAVIFDRAAWYFEKISPGASVPLETHVMLEKNASGSIPIQVQVEYDDIKGNSYTSEEQFKLSVVSSPEISLSNISFPTAVYSTDSNNLTMQVQNTGSSSVYNAKISFSGGGLSTSKELFLGTIEAGTAAEGELPVYAGTLNMEKSETDSQQKEKYGKTAGKLILTYEDEAGELYQEEAKIDTEILKPVNMELHVEKEETKTNQWWITIAVCSGILLCLSIIWIYSRMQYYKKRVELHERS